MSAQVFPCPYHLPCHTYTCRKYAKFFIGHPNTIGNCEAYCEDCVKSIAMTIPHEFLPGDKDVYEKAMVEARAAVNAQINALTEEHSQLQKQFANLVAQMNIHMVGSVPDEQEPMKESDSLSMMLTIDSEKTEVIKTDVPDPDDISFDPANADPANQVDTEDNEEQENLYRCLDCGAEFKTKANLMRHKQARHREGK